MSVQVCEIAGFLYTGIILGIVYGAFDIILCAFSARRTIVHIFDLLYVLTALVVSALAMYVLTYGRVSPVYIVFIFLGIHLYTRNMHRLIKELVHMG